MRDVAKAQGMGRFSLVNRIRIKKNYRRMGDIIYLFSSCAVRSPVTRHDKRKNSNDDDWNLLRPIHVRRLGWSAPTVYMVVQEHYV
jgi:hypothetical protein